MGITEEGIAGEQKLFKFLINKGFNCFQPDIIGEKEGIYYLFECKHQERFEPPPFKGHGLPLWQVKARLKFQEKFGIKCILVIFDKKTGEVFSQLLEVLEKGKHIDTKGLKPRRIYPIENFVDYGMF